MEGRPTVDGGPFGSPRRWRASDLIAMSQAFDADLVLTAYRHGVFPMPTGGAMGWYSPMERGILPLDRLRVTRSLRTSARRFEIRIDTAFDAVLAACGDPARPHGWIDGDIRRVYRELHRAGIVHSVEAWTADGELAGGLYGVGIAGLFAGESMFHRPDIGRDASKVALIVLVERLSEGGHRRLLDVQWQTPHLESLGAIEVPRADYLRRLEQALAMPPPEW
ncbi:leucyl/phenylalanyl-tRNA--protein transferase [Microlunatus ginsengisoli]|uniref:Leucyl/phenylalanyl-tRNA--protein transferase n=1 Tax=Microlunatus ginsengisoli TaxID=363863 RepID=A0ABP7AN31_9ACTN